VQARFLSLQYELLVEVEEDAGILIPVSLLQKHFEHNKHEPLLVQQVSAWLHPINLGEQWRVV